MQKLQYWFMHPPQQTHLYAQQQQHERQHRVRLRYRPSSARGGLLAEPRTVRLAGGRDVRPHFSVDVVNLALRIAVLHQVLTSSHLGLTGKCQTIKVTN